MTKIQPPAPTIVRKHLEAALAEDGFDRDITSLATVQPDAARGAGRFELHPREPGTFAGVAVLSAVAELFDGRITLDRRIDDGQSFAPGRQLATFSGRTRTILGLERTLLNFLQRLCGVATLTARYVAAIGETGVRIFDTRKTIPGWRALDKYAVRCGGGHNHRMGLHDAVLIKDNHVAGNGPGALARMIADAHARLAEGGHKPAFVEVEVDDLEQFREVLKADGVDVILLDNFSLEQMREAAEIRNAAGLRGRLELEVSGGVTLDAVAAIATTGIDRIAVGALTHSARAIDIGLDWVQ
jgi:nicotinate-nucleotide pyrophosphorylase (carboxylating)